jgi:outer membrane lipoprotein-sorting protein
MLVIVSQGVCLLQAQQIITADRYLEMVSQRYSEIRDYEARITIRSGNTDMSGTVIHLIPSFLRLDFTSPAEQVILFNEEQLIIYLPEYRAILSQPVASSRSSGASLATASGLSMLRRNFVPAFITSPDPQALEEGSPEKVVKLRLTRRSSSEGFRELILSIEPETKLIRRIEGQTLSDGFVRFDFSNITVNQGIPESRFIYNAPTSANVYNNFLFRDE